MSDFNPSDFGLDEALIQKLNEERVNAKDPFYSNSSTQKASSSGEEREIELNFPEENQERPLVYDWLEQEDEKAREKEGVTSDRNDADFDESEEEDLDDYDFLDEEEESDEEESDEEEGFPEDDTDNFEEWGKLAVGWVENIKTTANHTAEDLFHKKIQERFTPKEQDVIHALLFLDSQESLSKQSKDDLKEWAEDYGVAFKTMISLWVRYTSLRKRYQTSEMKDWEKEGIELYSKKLIKKYLQAGRIPDEVMLTFFLGPSALEVARVFFMQWQENRAEKKRKKQAKALEWEEES